MKVVSLEELEKVLSLTPGFVQERLESRVVLGNSKCWELAKITEKVWTFQTAKLMGSKPGSFWVKAGPS